MYDRIQEHKPIRGSVTVVLQEKSNYNSKTFTIQLLTPIEIINWLIFAYQMDWIRFEEANALTTVSVNRRGYFNLF